MKELDFVTFGVQSKNEILLQRIYEALSEIYSFGNLQLRAAWLYYGSKSKAAKAFNIAVNDYQNLVEPEERFPQNIILLAQKRDKSLEILEILRTFDKRPLNYLTVANFKVNNRDKWEMFRLVAEMLLEMTDNARINLFSSTSEKLSKVELIKKINVWQNSDNKRVIHKSKILLEWYILMLNCRKHPRVFFQSHVLNGKIKRMYEYKNEIEELANFSKLCSVALDIIEEYETYLEQWTKTRNQMKKQRNIATYQHKKFFTEIANRDGLKCATCGEIENLRLDHIKAIAHGGLSILENFQLLCFSCNSQKGMNEKALIYG